jgi:(p)ppGpp synthase/HD superfamily hydrolase
MTTAEIIPFGQPPLAEQHHLTGDELVRTADMIAFHAHAGQMYDHRTYYDGHLKPIAEFVDHLGFDSNYVAAALLHDVVEDTPLTVHDLSKIGMPPTVTRAVDLVTKRDGIDYNNPKEFKAYLEDIASDPCATVVKYADSMNNLANTALMQPPVPKEKMQKRLRRYRQVVSHLGPMVILGSASEQVASIPHPRRELA